MKLGFGKHKNMTYEEMAASEVGYLKWMVKTFDANDPRRIAAEEALGLCANPAPPTMVVSCAPITPEKFGNGKEMMAFQKIGLGFLESTDGNALIADHMGLGKTVQALAYLAEHPDMRPAVIVCPASLKLNWKNEAEAWLETGDTIEVINSGKVHEVVADIVVVNYDVLKKWVPELSRRNPQILIMDESHIIKNNKAARAKAAASLATEVPHKILLTGTPVLNRPSELWNQLCIISPGKHNSKTFFSWHKRYTAAHQNHFGWDFSGASHLDELVGSLQSIMIRRTKADVLPDLPDKRRQTILIPVSNAREYARAEKTFKAYIVEQKMLDEEHRDPVVAQFAKVEALRQLAVAGKMKQSLAWIENFLESCEKMVIFATHKATIHAIEREFGNACVKIDGSVSIVDRQAAVDAFQNDPAVRLFIGNIKAAGVGITLTASSTVVFLELDWTPAMHEQAEDRCHRIGQKNAVNIYYLLAADTVDQKIADMLERKRTVVAGVTNDNQSKSFDLFNLIGDE